MRTDLLTLPAAALTDQVAAAPDQHLPVIRDALVVDAAWAAWRQAAPAMRAPARVLVVLTVAAAVLWAVGLTAAPLATAGGAAGAATVTVQRAGAALAHVGRRRRAIEEITDALQVHIGLRATVTLLASNAPARHGPVASLYALAIDHVEQADCTGGHSRLCRHRRR